MRELKTHCEIDAPPERVWRCLLDFSGYVNWNPYLLAVKGELEPKASLEVQIQPARGMARVVSRRVTEVVAGREFSWTGHFIARWLFTGVHSFRVLPGAGGGTRFENVERFSGLLVPVFWPLLTRSVRAQFEAMNQALKGALEGAGGATGGGLNTTKTVD